MPTLFVTPSPIVKIPFLDLEAPYAELRSEIDSAIQRVLDRGWFILGDEVRRFEEDFARYCGAGECIGVSNGLDALQVVLRAWNIGAGDEVIVPSHTFIATWLAVTYTGATPVPVEVDPLTFTLDPDRIAERVSPRTRAIIPVHLYGLTADMDSIMNLADRHGLKVLEDAAQAHGATYHGRRAGSLGHAAAFSFYPAKNLGAMGDAGGVVTSDANLARRVRRLCNYGAEKKYEHVERGLNARLDEIQAAILGAKLPHVEDWNRRRQSVAAAYDLALEGGTVGRPHVPAWAQPSWHLYVVRCADRDTFRQKLADRGIQSLIHYPTPPHLQPAYKDANIARGSLPIAEALADQVLSLPIGPHLTAVQVDYIVEQLKELRCA
jgi:dTDP-4-amino-4,6-dideoxygalactose transaminase